MKIPALSLKPAKLFVIRRKHVTLLTTVELMEKLYRRGVDVDTQLTASTPLGRIEQVWNLARQHGLV